MVASVLGLGAMAEMAPISTDDRAFFDAKIRPVLEENCYKCHSRDADKI